MESKKVIILGSSRSNGNTTRIVNEIASQFNIDVVNLKDYKFSYYDYESKNREDDFLPLIKGIIEKYDTLIFATPIYWYSMSGIMKVFFDRVISNSHDDELEYDFYLPFRLSAEYLGMEYLGNQHFNADNDKQTDKIELAFI